MIDIGYPAPLTSSAAQAWTRAGQPVPWQQNWKDGHPVLRGHGGIQDRCDLFEAGDATVFQRPWTERERRRVLELLATPAR